MKITKIIKYSASWCKPCRLFNTTFHNVASREEFKSIEFGEYDIEKDEEGQRFATQHNINSIPTTVLFDDNNDIVYKIIGNVSEEDFVNTIHNTNKFNEEK